MRASETLCESVGESRATEPFAPLLHSAPLALRPFLARAGGSSGPRALLALARGRCGRVLLFLAAAYPLSERSAVNVGGKVPARARRARARVSAGASL